MPITNNGILISWCIHCECISKQTSETYSTITAGKCNRDQAKFGNKTSDATTKKKKKAKSKQNQDQKEEFPDSLNSNNISNPIYEDVDEY